MEEKTIFTALNSYCDEKTLEAIFAACRGREDLPDCTIQKLAEEYSVATTLSMENIHSNSELSYDYVRTGILSEDVNTAIESLAFCLGRRDVPADIIASALEMRDDRLTRLAYAVCDGTDLPIATICEWAQSQIVFQIAALHACRRFQEIRPEIVKDACEAFASLEDKKLCDDLVHKMDINEEYLTEWLLSSDQISGEQLLKPAWGSQTLALSLSNAVWNIAIALCAMPCLNSARGLTCPTSFLRVGCDVPISFSLQQWQHGF